MRLWLPNVDPAVRATEATPRFWVQMIPMWLGVLGLPWLPGFTRVTGLDRVEALILVAGHVSLAALLALPPLRWVVNAWERGVYALVAAIMIGLTCLIVYFSGDPGSGFWAFYYLYMAVMAAAFLPGSIILSIMAALGPLATALAFRARGHAWQALTMPLFSCVAGPAFYRVLAGPAHRARLARQASVHLRQEEARARMDHERLQLSRDVSASVGAALVELERDASLAAAGSGPPEAVPARVRGALRELRAAVWALDPDDAPWTAVEPHLWRMASELAGTHGCALESSLPGDTVLTATARMALWRAVQRIEGARGAARIRIGEDAARLWAWVDPGDGRAEGVDLGPAVRPP